MSAAAARRAGGESFPCAGRVSRNGTPAKPMTGKGGSLLRGGGRKSGRLCVQFARPWSRSSAGRAGKTAGMRPGPAVCGTVLSWLGGRRIFCRRRKPFRCSCLPREGRLKCPNCRCAHRPAMSPSAGGANRNMVPGCGSCAFDKSPRGGGDRNEILLIAYSLDGGSSPTRGRGSKFREQGRDGGERRRLPREGGGSKFAALGAAQPVRCVASHTGM